MSTFKTLLIIHSNVHPSQGGRYVGFGNSVEVVKKDDYWSSLSSVSVPVSYFNVC